MIGSIMGKDWPLVEGIDPSKIVVAVCLDRISRGGQPPNKFVTLLEPLYADPYEKEKGILQVQVQLRNKRDESVVKEMEFHRSFLTSDISEQWGSFSLQHLADPVYTVWKNAMNNNRRGLKVSEYADFLHQSLGNQVKVFTSVKDPEQQVKASLDITSSWKEYQKQDTSLCISCNSKQKTTGSLCHGCYQKQKKRETKGEKLCNQCGQISYFSGQGKICNRCSNSNRKRAKQAQSSGMKFKIELMHF